MNKTLLAALLSCACAAAFAAPPTDASLEKLMKVQRYDAMLEEMSAQFPEMTKQLIAENGEMKAALARIPADKRQQVADLTEKFARNIAKETNTPAFKGRLKTIIIDQMRATYTQEEVDAMITFFDSPLGRSVMKKQVVFAAKSMPAITALMQEATAKYGRNYMRDLERIAKQ